MEKLLDWFRNYIITNKAVFLTWGLVLSHSLAEYAVVFVLIDFLAEKYSSLSLRKAAMVVNLIDGGSALFLVIVSHVSEAWTGRLIMICVCTAAYVAGLLILLYVTDYFLPFNLLYLALGLVALVVNILIDHLGDNPNSTHELSLRESAIIVNMIDGGSAAFVVIVTHISEAKTGHFKMIGLCTVAYITGLILLWVTAKSPSKFYLFYAAAVLIALGKAVKDPILEFFLEFQLSEKVKQNSELVWGDDDFSSDESETDGDGSEEEKEFDSGEENDDVKGSGARTEVESSQENVTQGRERRKPAWMDSYVSGEGLSEEEVEAYMVQDVIGDDPIQFEEAAALLKLNFVYADSSEKILDKAAIIREASNLSPERQEEKGELCGVKEVKEVKSLIPVIYMGLTFLAHSLVVASGNTYFVEQQSNLNPKIGEFTISASIFFVLRSSIRDIVIFSIWLFGFTQRLKTTWRIGTGMFYAVLCFIAAWLVELHRLRLIEREGVLQYSKKILPMSVLWLIPQYFLLGLMEALALNGLGNFFYDHVPKSMRKFEQPFSEIVLSIGTFFSVPFVLIFGSSFKETINTSHLNKYFLVLAILSFVFFCIYLYYSSGYNFKEVYSVHEESDLMKQTSEEIQDAAREELSSVHVFSDIEAGIGTPQGVEDEDNHANIGT
ncbi:hypothetical protein L6164_002207 [Bauhinia variegata]|uniref:Uncharacterized protein n=1 Tax=Bauhinia variegata TaxID=167791 RepID=A0ACB9PXB9_BAUVA|nr:hypothetical protein L6164_002207 [Bauhinia variegata]